MERQTFLHAAQVDLVLVSPDDAEDIARWFNDAEVTCYLSRGAFPMTLLYEREYLEKLYTDQTDMMLGLWHKRDKKLIGTIGLHRIDHINQIASFGICIGEKSYWGGGIGTEALTTMLRHAFGRLNLRTVTLSVLSNNPRGQKCYEKCGFTKIGQYPQCVLKDGAWCDEILMIAQIPTYG